jgi:hypothetical protein
LDYENIQVAVGIAKAMLGANTAFLEQLDQRGFERYLIYKVAVLTGLRRGEIASLTLDHLRLDGPTALLSMKPKDTKNREAALKFVNYLGSLEFGQELTLKNLA